MLTNYDAKAVAEVMGIAFLRSSNSDGVPSTISSAAQKAPAKSQTGAFGGDFVISVDDTLMLVVAMKTNDAFSQSNQSKGGASQYSGFENNLVSPPSALLIEKAVE